MLESQDCSKSTCCSKGSPLLSICDDTSGYRSYTRGCGDRCLAMLLPWHMAKQQHWAVCRCSAQQHLQNMIVECCSYAIGMKFMLDSLRSLGTRGSKLIRLDAFGYATKTPGTRCFFQVSRVAAAIPLCKAVCAEPHRRGLLHACCSQAHHP